MSRTPEPYLIRARSDQSPGEWTVWLRPLSGLPPAICNAWTRRSLRTAPPLFLCKHPWPKTKGQAERVVQALIRYLMAEKEAEAPRGGPTVANYARLYETDKSPRAIKLAAAGRPYSPNTLQNYRDRIEGYIAVDPNLGPMRMGEVQRKDLEAFFAGVASKVGASRTLQDTWQILHMIFVQWGDDNKAPSPFRGMPKPTYQEQIRGALSEAELRKLFEGQFPTPFSRAICALAFWAGLRRSEVFALRWADVDLPNKRITVSHAVKNFSRSNRTEGETKGRKVRVVPMVSYVAEALEDLPHYDEFVLSFPGGRRPQGRVNRGDGRPTKWDWEMAMHESLARAGVDLAARHVTPHSSRHSIASVLLAQGIPKEDIRKILGHFDERTTDGYLHMAVDAIDRMRAGMDRPAQK